MKKHLTTLDNIGFYTLSEERCINASVSSPLYRVEIILTSACNFKCPYCRGQRKEFKKTLALDEAKATIDLFVSEGLKNIRFSGGEPTVWKGLTELVKYSKQQGIEKIAISTNGSAKWSLYQDLINAGANDFSVSLDACCSAFGDKMAGVAGAWETVVENIRNLSKQVYTTVGVVVTEDTLGQLKETVEFADSLGVSDIRIISAAQYNQLLEISKTIPESIYEKYPILKYRITNTVNNINVRGINENDSHRCHIAIDDLAVAGDYHYPCIIYFREQGDPIGKIGPNIRKEREEWIKNHDTHKDPICKKNCLDCIVQYNNTFEKVNKYK